MATYDDELPGVARRLLSRRAGQRGKLPSARIRRSVSTIYYALFHFIVEEAANRTIGAEGGLRRRRRVLSRVFTHGGIKRTLDKVKGATADASVADLLVPPGSIASTASVPGFAREL